MDHGPLRKLWNDDCTEKISPPNAMCGTKKLQFQYRIKPQDITLGKVI